MFSKKTAPALAVARPAASRPMGNPTFSILGADTAIKGDISSASDLHIDGRVDGDIRCAGLVQGETSEIAGSIVAQSAKLAGLVEGTIEADELVIHRTARIRGDVIYNTLSIEPGAQVDGRFSAGRGAQPGSVANDRHGFDPVSAEDHSGPALLADSAS